MGRPPTERGAYNWEKPRQIGRVSDADWEYIRAGAKASGLPTFSEWALLTLKAQAGKDLQRQEESNANASTSRAAGKSSSKPTKPKRVRAKK